MIYFCNHLTLLCVKCTNCKSCANCKKSVNCKSCANCEKSVNCKSSANCEKSVNCKSSANCEKSVNCKSSANCEKSEDITNKPKNNVEVVTCKNCTNYEKCANCKDCPAGVSDIPSEHAHESKGLTPNEHFKLTKNLNADHPYSNFTYTMSNNNCKILKVSCLNVCGLAAKFAFPDLDEFVHKYDIVGLTEAKLDE